MKLHYKGIIIANNTHEAKNGLDRMRQLFSVDEPPRHLSGEYLVITRGNFSTAGRGCQVGNRVLVFDLDSEAIPEGLWEAIIPCIVREPGERLGITYITREYRRFSTIIDHVFTVRRQDGLGPYPTDLPCAHPVSTDPWEECGQRADQHQPRPISRSAQGLATND